LDFALERLAGQFLPLCLLLWREDAHQLLVSGFAQGLDFGKCFAASRSISALHQGPTFLLRRFLDGLGLLPLLGGQMQRFGDLTIE
jgi:hypothetical protein